MMEIASLAPASVLIFDLRQIDQRGGLRAGCKVTERVTRDANSESSFVIYSSRRGQHRLISRSYGADFFGGKGKALLSRLQQSHT